MLKLNIILSFYCFWLIFCVITCNGEYKKCKINLANCPENTMCSQTTIHDDGECVCITGYVFNIIYKNDTDYCLIISKSNNNTTNATDSTMNSQLQKYSAPTHHHIIGGIFIPISVVFLIIGLYFGIKRFDVIPRIREYFISRRRQPFYEDVIMNNDLDDSPPIV